MILRFKFCATIDICFAWKFKTCWCWTSFNCIISNGINVERKCFFHKRSYSLSSIGFHCNFCCWFIPIFPWHIKVLILVNSRIFFMVFLTLFYWFFFHKIFRLGFVIDFLSKATLVGFMAGAAIIVSLQQLKGLLGIVHFTNKMQIIPVLLSVYNQKNEVRIKYYYKYYKQIFFNLFNN